VINTNSHPISYHFGVIAAYGSNFRHLALLSPLWELRDKVRCSSWAHWKACSGLSIMLIELFSLGVMGEALQANIGLKLVISLQWGLVDQNFR